MSSRTVRDYSIGTGDIQQLRGSIVDWLTQAGFKILSPDFHGPSQIYEPKAIVSGPRVPIAVQAQFVLNGPMGSILAMHTAYGRMALIQPLVFSISLEESGGGVKLHGEFYFPGPKKSLFFGDLPLPSSQWGVAAMIRMQAWPLLRQFEAFLATLNRPLQAGSVA